MTRDEQAVLIRKSIDEWNKWRANSGAVRPDLRGADLRGADLRGAYLRGADLRGADLRGADLRGAYLRGADLRGADLRGAHLSGAHLSDADLSGADLRGAYLGDADLRGAYLRGASLRGADLRGANLSDAIKIERMVCRLYRFDDHLFMGFDTNVGLMIKAGCRLLSPDEYRQHIAKEYPGTAKARKTLRIIQCIEDCSQEKKHELRGLYSN